jgi:aspartate/methionine/tyrosine aminotransferase
MSSTLSHRIGAGRIEGLGQSIFSVMTRLAVEFDAVNLGQGFPDFDGPEWLIEEYSRALRSGRNQYAPMQGTAALRKAVARYQREFWSLEWDVEDEITVTAGATEALLSAILALVDPGEEVVLFEPFYDAHLADVRLAGATPRFVTLHAPDFRIDAAALEAAITPRTRMLVLNSPHNPTGRVFSKDELSIVAAAAIEHDLLVLSDEVYEFLTYGNARHIPIASLPGMRERTVTVSSTGKTFGMTGWKIGYAMAAGPLSAAIRGVHQFATFAVNTPAQLAMSQALGRLSEYLPAFRAAYQAKRDMLLGGLADTGYKCIEPEGTYFTMMNIPAAVGRGDVELAEHLIREYRVAVIPPSVFYGHSDEGTSMLRLCFAKREETLAEGLRRLRSALVAI